MRKLFSIIKERTEAGKSTVLASVTASSGATPRAAGSRMLVGEEGLIYGTIGGGNVEYKSIELAMEALSEKKSKEHFFRLNRSDVENLGMICGGDADVSFRYIGANDANVISECKKAEALFAANKNIWFVDSPKFVVAESKPDAEGFCEQVNKSGFVYIFGGGHVAQALVPILASVDFKAVVMDDRDEFTNPKLFPNAFNVQKINFSRINDYINITDDDFVCVMTRGHAFDTKVEAQVLNTPAYYIGVIGSVHKKAGVEKQLVEEYGISKEHLVRIITPIGANIKAETPAEIAISITAQLIEYRANKNNG